MKCFDRVRLLFGGTQWKAWLVCLCTVLTYISILGTMLSFGAWFLKLEREFDTNTTVIGWIGSVTYGLLCLASPLSTPLFLRYGHRKVALCGVVLCSASLLSTSFVPHIGYMFVTYSLLYGLGANFVFNSSINLVGAHFQHRYRSLATCLASTGFAIGTLVMNPVTEAILSTVGLRNTYRILSAMILVKGVICCSAFVAPPSENGNTASMPSHDQDKHRALAHPGEKVNITAMEKLMEHEDTSEEEKSSVASSSTNDRREEKKNHFLNVFRKAVWTNPGFLVWLLANVVLCLSLLFPFFHLVKYMTTLGIPEKRGVIVASVAGFSELAGRLLCGLLGDILPFPKAYLFPTAALVMAVDTFSCLLITTFAGMIVDWTVYGHYNMSGVRGQLRAVRVGERGLYLAFLHWLSGTGRSHRPHHRRSNLRPDRYLQHTVLRGGRSALSVCCPAASGHLAPERHAVTGSDVNGFRTLDKKHGPSRRQL